jgi:hypothetical protein
MLQRPAVTRTATLVAAAWVVALAVGCSGGDGNDINARGSSVTVAETTVAPDADAIPPDTASPIDGSPSTLLGEVVITAAPPPSPPPGPTVPPPSVSDVPETGVPGLDSTDVFCAAWSRFGGSFQVVAVNAAFGAGSVEDRAVVEVVAGPTVVAAHAEMTETWPAEIAAESSVALDDAFGPFARRLAAATDALAAVGLTEEQAVALDDAWLAFLAERDPTDADVDLVVPADLTTVVGSAVPLYLDTVGPWAEDETLVTDASTPLTDEYLATSCPDQGTLLGGEIDG